MEEEQIMDALNGTDPKAEEDHTQEESSTPESQTEDQPETEPEEGEVDEKVPFHKHPRWIEMREQYKSEVEELQGKIKDLESQITKPKEEAPQESSSYSPQMQKLITDIVSKVRNEAVNDVISTLRSQAEEQTKLEQEKIKQAQKVVEELKAGVGDDTVFEQQFKPFLQNLYDTALKNGETAPGWKTALALWKSQGGGSPKRDRVSSPSKSGAAPSKGFVPKKGESFDDVAERFLRENS